MIEFPVSLLNPINGQIGPHPMKGCFIHVPIEPFQFDGEEHRTALRWDFIDLLVNNLTELQNSTMTFSKGATDASFYLVHAHHPVDILSVQFGKFHEHAIVAKFATIIDFPFEGLDSLQPEEEYSETYWNFECVLEWSDCAPA